MNYELKKAANTPSESETQTASNRIQRDKANENTGHPKTHDKRT